MCIQFHAMVNKKTYIFYSYIYIFVILSIQISHNFTCKTLTMSRHRCCRFNVCKLSLVSRSLTRTKTIFAYCKCGTFDTSVVQRSRVRLVARQTALGTVLRARRSTEEQRLVVTRVLLRCCAVGAQIPLAPGGAVKRVRSGRRLIPTAHVASPATTVRGVAGPGIC